MAGRLGAPFVLALLTAPWVSHCAHEAGRPAPAVKAVPVAVSSREGPGTALGAAPLGLAEPPAFFSELAARARSLSEAPPAPSRQMELPATLRDLDYDGYRKVRFRPDRSLWRGQPGSFEVQFFHPGPSYRDPVAISTIEGGKAQPLPFSSDWFSYEGLAKPPPAAGLEFTGLRVHAPLNTPSYRDEVVAFHGASYFRPLGKGNVYGLSARGLAIDLGEPRPEEFPCFTELYLVHPAAGDELIWILGLLESRRATGAYAFRLQPGSPTSIEVTAELFLRERPLVLGLAPLTSMYLFGEDAPNRFGDFRPEVHDSDGLSLWSHTGEWLFRPLRNPEVTTASSFRLDSPRGFGLMQRDRSFDHYQDLEARYQDRPSIWVETISGFERGSVRLLEITSKSEAADNVAMAWVPDELPDQTLRIRYRLYVGGDGVASGPPVRAVATRIGRTERGARFLVDFVGRDLQGREGVQVVVSGTRGRVLEQHLETNSFVDGLRASFEVALEPNAKDAELRAFLKSDSDVLTETWSYLWQPKE